MNSEFHNLRTEHYRGLANQRVLCSLKQCRCFICESTKENIIKLNFKICGDIGPTQLS